jgi:hypothetical protein
MAKPQEFRTRKQGEKDKEKREKKIKTKQTNK